MGANSSATGRAVVIAGPTASGKSAVALALAERFGGVIINADSMQVYADLRVLTARPSDPDMAIAPHHLFGHVDGADAYSVGRWLGEVDLVLQAAWAEGRVPILVGGTGLYFKALTYGLSDIPEIPPGVRMRVRAEAEGQSPQSLHMLLASVDPIMAERLRPTDPQRIVRALEVFAATGTSLANFHQSRRTPLLPASGITGIFLSPEREALNRQIDRRFDDMMAAGAMLEIEALAARHLDPALPAMRALGVPPLLAAQRRDLPIGAAIISAKLLTRQYAKRQVTFARNQLPDLMSVRPDDAFEIVVRRWLMDPPDPPA